MKTTEKHQILDQGAIVSKPTKQFSEGAWDHLQMALVHETSSRGTPVLDKWSEIETRLSRIIVDHVMANPEGQSPGFDSVEVVRGCRVIKCGDQYSNFLTNAIGEIQRRWEGLRLKFIPVSEIPLRPRSVNSLSPGSQPHSVSFFLQITDESLEPVQKVENKLRFGTRKAQLKIFRSANLEEKQDEVDGTSELLTSIQLNDAEPGKTNQ
ncbi:uncharacterized protein LOC128869977 [Anastrepha ludens]|uniref:uncharacterized protein LOC128869977 n=1 Tax=Anastrepha ludens TaxID=28586 RepID=UPI0023AED581|nr:uncharacterized protein LOC128869977 [Anastrepha ludens]